MVGPNADALELRKLAVRALELARDKDGCTVRDACIDWAIELHRQALAIERRSLLGRDKALRP